MVNRCFAWCVSVVMICGLAGCDGGATNPNAEFPSRSLKIICPWSPGGGTDRITRYFADALREELGTTCTPLNQTGGGGVAGHQAGALAPADGHTLTMITFELSTMKQMGLTDLTYRDYRCLMQVNADPAAILVKADSPWMTLGDLLEHIGANPGQVRMTGTDSGGAWDLARAGLLLAAGLKVQDVTWVPKRGSAPSLVELLGGHVEAVCCSLPEAVQSLAGGELRALAVMAEQRLEAYADVPTAREAGYDWVAVGWRGLAVPKQTPDKAYRALLLALDRIVLSPQFVDFMKKNDFQIELRSGDAFTDFLAAQESQWKGVIEAGGFSQEAP